MDFTVLSDSRKAFRFYLTSWISLFNRWVELISKPINSFLFFVEVRENFYLKDNLQMEFPSLVK